ncbi:MAG: PAS-domain containing protein [Gemmobacter sp.]
MSFDPYLAAGLVATALLAAMLAVVLLSFLAGPDARRAAGIFAEPPGMTTFLFDGESLVDATPGARAVLAHSPMRSGTPWVRLLAWLHPHFPDVPEALARLPTEGRVVIASAAAATPTMILTAELRGGLIRLMLTEAEGQAPQSEPLADHAAQDELALLRRAVSQAPTPLWREDAEGAVTWANAAYLDLALRRLPPGSEIDWPLPRLFERTASAQGARSQRQKLAACATGPALWYDLAVVPDGAGRLVFALPADSAVQAETSLRTFMQTLTKTFAHLRTGLAIFDAGRQLQLFNPALIDLTGLPPEMLSARPTLAAFLDGLRDRSMIPEPRDYRSWRRQMTEMEAAAASGLYEEVWNLPSGQAYRVTGRPHPDGALALVFEDISTEVTRTRRYHADVELGQSVIDTMDDGVAVFSAAGTLVMSNAAYAGVWGHDPGATLDGATAATALCHYWRERSGPTMVWDRIEDFVAALDARPGWTDEVRLSDGRPITCRVARLVGGATLVMFREEGGPLAVPEAAAPEPPPQFATARRTA